jgi:hypothetical protein
MIYFLLNVGFPFVSFIEILIMSFFRIYFCQMCINRKDLDSRNQYYFYKTLSGILTHRLLIIEDDTMIRTDLCDIKRTDNKMHVKLIR